MLKLGIIGSREHGKAIEELFKTLGGINKYGWSFTNETSIYYIDDKNTITSTSWLFKNDFKVYSYENFKEEYPFELNDFVYYQNRLYKVYGKVWDSNSECIKYNLEDEYKNDCNGISVNDLSVTLNYKSSSDVWIPCDFTICNSKRVAFSEDKTELILKDNFEIVVEDGKTFVVRKQQIYPRTYEQCCDIVGAFNHSELVYKITDGYDCPYDTLLLDKLNSYRKLLICRNAYWKICNYQPNWNDDSVKYYIQYSGNDLIKDEVEYGNKILAFPTSDMRDVFYDNFSELIERCKDLI